MLVAGVALAATASPAFSGNLCTAIPMYFVLSIRRTPFHKG
jgi:hypothetical protein